MGIFNFLKPKSYSEKLIQQSYAHNPAASGQLMTIDDVFHIRGRGSIVVGKVDVPIHKGQAVVVHGAAGKIPAKVTELKSHKRSPKDIIPGDTVAILLANIDHKQLQRGDKIVAG